MEPAYCERSRQLVIDVAKELGIEVHKKGTVVAIEGPRFSSRAESLMHRQWGVDVINMTSVPEVIYHPCAIKFKINSSFLSIGGFSERSWHLLRFNRFSDRLRLLA